MQLLRFASTVMLVLLALAGCVEEGAKEAGAAAHPNLIIVREFAFAPGVVTLDPSLGFSLNRGSPGAPPRARAATVGRAAAFSLADTITQQLAALGYDVVRSDTAAAEGGGRALIVTGRFHRIFEGHRRQGASVAVAVEIDYQADGSAPRRLAAFDIDSRSTPPLPRSVATARNGADVNAAADRVGLVVGQYVATLAHRSSWPGAPR
jgi:hypothetical protein